MIGETPKGAPLRCKLGRHKPAPGAGLMVFTCARCGGSFWQPADHRADIAAADRAIERGAFDEAERIRAAALGERPML